MVFSLNESVLKVINTIEKAGGEAYIVGGCVRDMLLSRTPGDFDITTSLPPEKIITLFKKTVATGLKHGTVTVIINRENIEVTTYRTEGVYSDSRHPNEVHFVRSLTEDLSRRDFTVNAIAYNPKNGIVDKFGGIEDLNSRLLRTVGYPTKRFSEDALRIMRLFRFACQLDFSIDKETERAALSLSGELKNISRERIAAELFKALVSPHPERLSALTETGALTFCGIEKGSVSSDIASLPLDRDIRFYRFISDLKGNHIAVCKELKTDKALQCFCSEVAEILPLVPRNIPDCKRALKNYSQKAVYSALVLAGGDTGLISRIEESKEPYRIKDLCISGEDLKEMGITGKAVGRSLERLLEAVIEHPELNTKESLSELL